MSGAEIHEDSISRVINGIQIENIYLTGQKFPKLLDINNWYGKSKFFPDDLNGINLTLISSSTNDITWQNGIKKFILPSYHSKNMKVLETAFDTEIKKYSNYLITDKNNIKIIFKKTAAVIAELPFKNGTIEIIKGNGFKFHLVFPNNYLLMISKSFENVNSTLNKNEIIFSLFINRQLIASNTSELETFKEGFKKFLSM